MANWCRYHGYLTPASFSSSEGKICGYSTDGTNTTSACTSKVRDMDNQDLIEMLEYFDSPVGYVVEIKNCRDQDVKITRIE